MYIVNERFSQRVRDGRFRDGTQKQPEQTWRFFQNEWMCGLMSTIRRSLLFRAQSNISFNSSFFLVGDANFFRGLSVNPGILQWWSESWFGVEVCSLGLGPRSSVNLFLLLVDFVDCFFKFIHLFQFVYKKLLTFKFIFIKERKINFSFQTLVTNIGISVNWLELIYNWMIFWLCELLLLLVLKLCFIWKWNLRCK